MESRIVLLEALIHFNKLLLAKTQDPIEKQKYTNTLSMIELDLNTLKFQKLQEDFENHVYSQLMQNENQPT